MLYKYTIFLVTMVVVAASGFLFELIALPPSSPVALISVLSQLCLFGTLLIVTGKAYEAERAIDLRLKSESQLQHLTKLDEIFPHE